MNGTISMPKSVVRFVSGLRTSTSAVDFYKLLCYPVLLFPNKRSDNYPTLKHRKVEGLASSMREFAFINQNSHMLG